AEQATDASYTIQYMDDSGIHKITVQKGDIYTLDVIPEKSGYVFLGLFSAESGGTQYVSASGQAVAPFNDDRNVVLYPQFKPKEYKLILDYQGAAVTGSRSIAVDYDSAIRELPMNLSLENKVFTGWYTEPDRKGTQIADRYGILPENELVTERTFDLSDPEGKIRLYAGFESVKYTVTFYSEENAAPEEIKVEHGTNVADVVPSARVNGQAVLVWSKTKNDTARENVFTGKVTGDMVLYAVEYAPVIDFDANGGDDVVSLVAKAGDPITLPTPTRKNYKFAEWQDPQGNAYTATTMPTKGLTLKAVWQAKLVFDANGGTDVEDISKPAGETVTLPIPERDGFLFAGWYTADKEQYTATRMPTTSVELKAGWYKEKVETLIICGDNVELDLDNGRINRESLTPSLNINMSSFLPSNYTGTLKIRVHMKIKYTESYSGTPLFTLNYYSQNTVSEVYRLHSEVIQVNSSEYRDVSFVMTVNMSSNVLYGTKILSHGKDYSTYTCYYKITGYYVEVAYPDTSNLYL
ncbi:MAG: InlB B-repeat-containing protein, partial [Clostridia bacterium]|nr:InlB B-repeat-containing protein [Clostridia bacterium]